MLGRTGCPHRPWDESWREVIEVGARVELGTNMGMSESGRAGGQGLQEILSRSQPWSYGCGGADPAVLGGGLLERAGGGWSYIQRLAGPLLGIFTGPWELRPGS